MKLRPLFPLAVSILVCELVGMAGSVFTFQSIPTWYATLNKPALNPPSWVFGPVWVTLYALMGIAAFLVWQKKSKASKHALIAFGVQLFLNAIWTPIFFGMRNPLGGLIDILLLWIAIIVTIVMFSKISKSAAWLLAPYLAWVTFATYINYSIWKLN
jgi:translocator protein